MSGDTGDPLSSTILSAVVRQCKHSWNTPTSWKFALTTDNLERIIGHYSMSSNHDDKLFVSQLLTGFFALLHLGELVYPDDIALHNPCKISKWISVPILQELFQFELPAHEGDKFYQGNLIVVWRLSSSFDPYWHFLSYLQSRDHLFPYSSPLWLREDGSVPRRSFFIKRFQHFFGSDFGGQSMRAGGAIAFKIYIRKNPILIQTIIYTRNLPTTTS
jgi:hypothetical protein